VELASPLIKILIVIGVQQAAVAYLIYLERKVAAFIQDRLGPNRVGYQGLLQPLADGVKLFLKEEILPAGANRVLYFLAPAIALFTTTIALAVVPFGPTSSADPNAPQFVIAPGLDIGILYVFAIGSLAVYAVILGGWGSNSKYSFFGAMRSSAQVLSYEIPMGMSIIGVVLLARSLNLERIIDAQADRVWYIFYQPLGFLLFFVSALAETNRAPFDLPECEQELVGGYHTEYSALKWALFFFGEYTHVITVSALTVVLFFGGWDLPWVLGATPAGATISLGLVIAKVLVILLKVFLVIMVIMWIRWTLPRFRYDQLMGLAWRIMMPLALANLLLTAVVLHLLRIGSGT
jgi:NADH-quinone oxidoreductase subunit H